MFFSLRLKRIPASKLKTKDGKLLTSQQNGPVVSPKEKQKMAQKVLKKAKRSRNSPEVKRGKENQKGRLGKSQSKRKKLLLANEVAGCLPTQNVVAVNMTTIAEEIVLDDSPPSKGGRSKNVDVTKTKKLTQVLLKPPPPSSGKQVQKRKRSCSQAELQNKEEVVESNEGSTRTRKLSRKAAENAKQLMEDQRIAARSEDGEKTVSPTGKKDVVAKGNTVHIVGIC